MAIGVCDPYEALKLDPFFQTIDKHFGSPVRSPEGGFNFGGANRTADLLDLESFDGQPIEELEELMRPDPTPNGHHGVTSVEGFLGPQESLREVLAMDNRAVVDEMGWSHRELGALLQFFHNKTLRLEDGVHTIQLGAHEFEVAKDSYSGFQESPFETVGITSNTDLTIKNKANGKKIRMSAMIPYLIAMCGFYEGEGTVYRLSPRAIFDCFDLKRRT